MMMLVVVSSYQTVVGTRRFPEVDSAESEGRDGLLNVVSAETDMLDSRPGVYLQEPELEHF